MTGKTIGKYDHLRINVDELIPTFDDVRKYCELINGVTNNIPYFSNDIECTNAKFEKLMDELEGTVCEIHSLTDIIAGFIYYKALHIAKENINIDDTNGATDNKEVGNV